MSSRPVAATVIAGVAAAGVGIGAFVAADRTSGGDSGDAIASIDVEVRSADYADPRDVSVTVSSVESPQLRSQASGVVTDLRCQEGSTLASGSPVMAVNGEPVIGLATGMPLWRDLREGDRGPDVDAVRRAFADLGLPTAAGERLDESAARAIRQFLRDMGYSREALTGGVVLPLAAVIWLPARSVTVATCHVELGQPIDAGMAIAATTPRNASVRITPMPADLLPGARVVELGADVFAVDAAGLITDEWAADAVGAAASANGADSVPDAAGALEPATGTSGDGEPAIHGVLRLEHPVPAGAVPPAAVGEPASDRPCVRDPSGILTSVRVLSSELGLTIVAPLDGAELPSRVLVDSSGESACA